MIQEYFAQLENILQSFPNIRSYTLKKKVYSVKQGFISGSIIFDNEHTLEFVEVKDADAKDKVKYRYQYVNENQEMIFRYDNAPHHKHIRDDVKENPEPDLENILFEIAWAVRENT